MTSPCGCKVTQRWNPVKDEKSLDIYHCKKHRSVDALIEAAEAALSWIEANAHASGYPIKAIMGLPTLELIQEALARARGGKCAGPS